VSTERLAPERRRVTRREQGRLVAALVVAVLVTLFCVLNTAEVKVNWIVTTTRTPLIVLIIVSLVIGTAFGWFAHVGRRRRKLKSRR
jgi:uncharacterized integral membrane protein